MVGMLLTCSACTGLLASRRASPPPPVNERLASRPTHRVRDTPVVTSAAPNAIVAEPPEPEPDPGASDSAGVVRLMRLALVWHTIALHHPWVATRGIPWDSALIIAATRVRVASDDAALRSAYDKFVAILRDPITHIESATMIEPAPVAVTSERTGDSVVVIRIAPSALLDASDSALVAAVANQLPARVLIDVRGASTAYPFETSVRLDDFLIRTGLADRLVLGSIAVPTIRTRRIGVGGAATANRTVPVFQDGWQQPAERTVTGHATRARRVVILADSGTVLPSVLLAAHDAGASLVAYGRLRHAAPVPRIRVPITTGLVATIRVGELVHADGSVDVLPDTTLQRAAAVAGDHGTQAAMAMLRAPARLPLAERPLPQFVAAAVTPVFYDTTAYPFMGARLLAGFRLWSAMRARHAHRDLYDDDLEAVFERVIPRLEAARSAEEYAKGIAELAASLDDAEGMLHGVSYDAVVGAAAFPFRVRSAEGRVFITDIIRDSATSALLLVPGTEIVAIDGFPTVAWLSEHRRMAPASNDWTRTRSLMPQMSRGRARDATVRVRDANNRERALSVPRRVTYRELLPTVERPSGAPTRLLSDGIGYLDVERLTEGTVEAAFAAVAAVRGLVLDLRGGLTVNDARLLRHLATKPRALIGRVVQRTLTGPCLAAIREAAVECPDVRETEPWWRTVDTVAVFGGRIVALIDERTQGAMERFALSLEQMSTVTLIGSASAGALSWTTPLSLPGGLSVGIATQEIRRADGGQIQRVGLTPAVDARPTARGLRAGDDEVLARAHQWLQQQLDPPRRRR